ncbi:hypothetical protein GW931_03600 [archaeon]|nr:hypothetical protein [archaeon]
MATKKEEPKVKRKVSTKFAGVLALISITGFVEIILKSFFNVSLQQYSSFLWLFIMGFGFIIITKPKNLYKKTHEAINENTFTRLTTFVLGCMAIIVGILSLPQVNIEHPILYATMGVISIISIIFIIIQTWVIKE